MRLPPDNNLVPSPSPYGRCEVILMMSFIYQRGEGADITAKAVPGGHYIWKCESRDGEGQSENTTEVLFCLL